jgi:hypothetical protein
LTCLSVLVEITKPQSIAHSCYQDVVGDKDDLLLLETAK